MDALPKTIAQTLATRDDVLSLVAEIDTYLIEAYKINPAKSGISRNVEAILKADEGEPAEKQRKVLEEAKKKLLGLPVVSLTLAFRTSEEFTREISRWVKKNVDPGAVVDLSTDGSVMGGAIVTFAGRYGNFTLAKQVAETFNLEREKILGLVK